MDIRLSSHNASDATPPKIQNRPALSDGFVFLMQLMSIDPAKRWSEQGIRGAMLRAC
jgi:hypothetical protein